VTNNLQIKISRNVVLPGVSYDVKHGLSLEWKKWDREFW
jgi:hypothetical protein